MNTILNNGISMPLLGLGVYDMHAQEAVNATRFAIETGYRLIDTASMYENEKEIGQAINDCQVPRNELFITTKVNNADQGFEQTLKAYSESLKKLQTILRKEKKENILHDAKLAPAWINKILMSVAK